VKFAASYGFATFVRQLIMKLECSTNDSCSNQIKVTVNRQSRMIERKIEGQNRRNFFSIKYQKNVSNTKMPSAATPA
jgi:hypothetical protein